MIVVYFILGIIYLLGMGSYILGFQNKPYIYRKMRYGIRHKQVSYKLRGFKSTVELYTRRLTPIRLLLGWPVLVFLGFIAVMKTPWKLLNTPFREMGLPRIRIEMSNGN
jgi:hypothetical protein